MNAVLGSGMSRKNKVHPLVLLDDNGERTIAGDVVRFSYGIPPVVVDAPIVERGGKLIGLCPGHNPPEVKLRSLRRYVGNWWRMPLLGRR